MPRCTLALLVFASVISAQPPAFDAATIKMSPEGRPASEGSWRNNIGLSPTSLTMRGVSLADCVEWAWDVREHRVSGPEWIFSQKYDIIAKNGAPVSAETMKAMLRTLLGEQMSLRTHRETKEIPVYALVPAKRGANLSKPVDEGKPAMRRVEGSLVFQNTTMRDLSGFLSTLVFVGRPVMDRTGLDGSFDFTIRFGATNEEMKRVTLEGDGASFFTLIQEQLGLKLEARRSAVETIAIDRADKTPKQQ